MYDNSFSEISDIPKAQELADQFDSKNSAASSISSRIKVNPYLDMLETIFHQGLPLVC